MSTKAKVTRVSDDQARMLMEALDAEEHDPPIPYTIENKSTTAASLQRKGLAIRVGMSLALTPSGVKAARDARFVEENRQCRRAKVWGR